MSTFDFIFKHTMLQNWKKVLQLRYTINSSMFFQNSFDATKLKKSKIFDFSLWRQILPIHKITLFWILDVKKNLWCLQEFALRINLPFSLSFRFVCEFTRWQFNKRGSLLMRFLVSQKNCHFLLFISYILIRKNYLL